MSASLQTLPVLAGATEAFTGASLKLSIEQLDSGATDKFGPVLGEAFAALLQPAEGAFEIPLDDNPLNDMLQTLPEGGKLLPLLEEALNEAVATGVEPQQVVDRITDRLDALQVQPELNPAQQLAEVIKQVVLELPAMQPTAAQTSLPAQASVTAAMVLEGGESPVKQQRPQMPEAASQAPQNLLPKEGSVNKPVPDMPVELERVAPRSEQAVAQRSEQVVTQRSEQVAAQRSEQAEAKTLKLAGLEQAIERLQQQPNSEPRQADLATMLVAFKRLAADSRSGVAESAPRSDALVAPASVVAAVSTAGSAPVSSALPSVSLIAPFGQANWDQALGERIQWMVSQKMQGAEVKLNPAHLGPMEVRIQVQNDQASVFFSAQHGAVREALEAALPRLREMFENSGVELVDVDVSDQSFAEQRAMQDEDASEWAGEEGGQQAQSEAETVVETSLDGFVGRGVLDLFA